MNTISLLRGVLGLFLILGIAILFSNNRRRISWRLVGSGILIQVVFAVFILYSDTLRSWFCAAGLAQGGHLLAGRRRGQPARLHHRGLQVRLRPPGGQLGPRQPGRLFRLPGAADDHLRGHPDLGAVLPRHPAGGGQGHGLAHGQAHGHLAAPSRSPTRPTSSSARPRRRC